MSTYTPGITHYLPQTQPWRPNLSLYQQGLQRKQSQYDAAYNKISSLYGSLLNSPMLKESNLKKREEFFRAIDQDIKKISTMDLSLQQNVDSAMELFRPFYEDKTIVADMSWTRKWQSQLQKGESYKGCTNPDKCNGQYWPQGMEYLYHQAEMFKNSTDEESLSFEAPEFVPYQNINHKSFKLAKDLGFKITTASRDGGYIVTKTNGEQMYNSLTDFYISEYGNDPSVRKMYNVMATMGRVNYGKENAYKFQGDEKAAQKEYMQSIMAAYANTGTESLNKAKNNRDYVKNSAEAIENHVKVHGTTPDSPIVQAYKELAEELQRAQNVVDQKEEVHNVFESSVQTMDNDKITERNVDALMANTLFQKDMMLAAKNYADNTYTEKPEVDQYALASFKHKQRLSELATQHQYSKEKIYLNALAKQATQKAKNDNAQLDAKGTNEFNIFNSLDAGVGTSDPDVDTFGEQRAKILQYHNKALETEATYINKTVAYLQNEATRNDAAGSKAKTELKKILGKGYDEKTNGFVLDGKSVNDISAILPVASISKTYGTARSIMNGDKLYSNYVSNTLSKLENEVQNNRDFQKGESIQYLKSNSNIRKWARASEKIENKAMFDSLFDKNNNVRSRNEWTSSYMQLNPNRDAEDAVEAYDKLFDQYKEIYISGGMQKPGYEGLVKTTSPLPGAPAFAVGATGKYSSGGKVRFSGLYNASTSAVGLYSFTENARNAGRAKAIFGDDVTADDYEDFDDNETAWTAFEKISNDMQKGGYKASDDVIPGGELIYRGVSANNSNLASVTLKPDPTYLRTLLKSKSKENLLTKEEYDQALKGITVFMDKDKSKNLFKEMGEISKYDVLAEAGIPIKINRDGTANLVITKENGQVKTKGFLYENYIRGNDLVSEPLNASILPASTTNIGSIVNQYNYFVDKLEMKNQQTKDYYDQLRKVFSIAEAIDPKSKNKTKATATYEQMIQNLNAGN